jgi:catalase (peroxidase I)
MSAGVEITRIWRHLGLDRKTNEIKWTTTPGGFLFRITPELRAIAKFIPLKMEIKFWKDFVSSMEQSDEFRPFDLK